MAVVSRMEPVVVEICRMLKAVMLVVIWRDVIQESGAVKMELVEWPRGK